MARTPAELHVEFQEAFNRHEDDAVLVSGGAAVRWKSRDSRGLPRIPGDPAGHSACALWESSGQAVRREGRNTETARRQADGRWLFVIDNPSVA
jgi:hypothetical protein